jgi:L-aspartate oxidase
MPTVTVTSSTSIRMRSSPRANWRQQRRGPIYLDARMIGAAFPDRFPTVFRATMAAGIDPRREPIPTTPAQHYHIGGIRTDRHGQTSVAGLFACGEAASVGLHGANRLASNSLVEGLVMGARVAAAIGQMPAARASNPARLEVPVRTTGAAAPGTRRDAPRHTPDHTDHTDHTDHAAAADAVAELRHLMWEHGGLLRHADGLRTALREVDRLTPALERDAVGRNLAVVGAVILRAALARDGSRGGHHRIDHPEPETGPGHHTLVLRDDIPHVPLAASVGLDGLDVRHEVAS